jgi:tetratricopeptide (TPR) repeat protein
MRFVKLTAITSFLLAVLGAQAGYRVEITFNNGAKRTVDDLVVESDKVILAAENLQVPFDQIQSADFSFDEPLSFDECDVFLKRCAYKDMVTRLDALLNPVRQGFGLRGNLDGYLQYKMRACFWAKQYAEAAATADILQKKNSAYAPLAGLYQVLILLEQNKPADNVSQAFSQISDPEQISAPIAHFIRGRLAMETRSYDEALQHFSEVVVYHSRDPEWAPAAAFYEGAVYKRTGYLESASAIADELKIAYPDADWGRRADELK